MINAPLLQFLFYLLAFLLFFLLGLNSLIFERILYFNEALSLMGGIIFLKEFSKTELSILKHKVKRNPVLKWVILFLLWCVIHLIFSWFIKTSTYYYFRNTVIFLLYFFFFHWVFWIKIFFNYPIKSQAFLMGLFNSRISVPMCVFVRSIYHSNAYPLFG